ncbi:MAG: hypothetical protein ACYC7E_21890 [Armatimonadota bacterium]
MTEEAVQQNGLAQRLRQPVGSALLAAAVYLLFYVGMILFNAHPPRMPLALWLIVPPLTTVLYLLLLVVAIRLFCRLQISTRGQVTLFFVTLLLFLALNPAVHEVVRRLSHGESLLVIFGSLSIPDSPPILEVIVPFFLILAGTYFGQILARLIKERAILVPVMLVSGLIDFWGVYWGPVNQMSENAPMAVSGLATATTAAANIPPEVQEQLTGNLAFFGSIAPPDNIGIGDFVFLALFLTCAYRLGFSAHRTMWGVFWGLLVASVIMALDGVTLFGFEISISYLPGLLFICGGVLLANLRSWKLSRQEWMMTGVVVGVLALFIGATITYLTIENARVAREQQKRAGIVTYQLTAPAGYEVVQAVLEHIARGEKAPAELLPLDSQFLYVKTPDGLRLDQWKLWVLGREKTVTLDTSRDYVVNGEIARKHPVTWKVTQQTISPPIITLQQLRTPDRKDNLAIILSASGLPESSFALLDDPQHLAGLAGKQQWFILHLQLKGARLIGDKKQVLHELSYSTR